MNDVRDREHDLPAELRAATQRLREDEPVSDRWRAELLRAVASAAPSSAMRRREGVWRIWTAPVLAFAAGVAMTLVGLRLVSEPAGGAPLIDSRAQPVRFILVAPAAKNVTIVGDFNGWNPKSQPLKRSADGRTWVVDVRLAPGRYAYAFMVDGALERDPSAAQAREDDFGTTNSIVMVRGT